MVVPAAQAAGISTPGAGRDNHDASRARAAAGLEASVSLSLSGSPLVETEARAAAGTESDSLRLSGKVTSLRPLAAAAAAAGCSVQRRAAHRH